MVQKAGARILLLLVLLTASALVGVCLLLRNKTSIQLSQGISDHSSEDINMKLQGDHLAQFELNNGVFAPRKISYQHRQNLPRNSFRLRSFLWEIVTKRRSVHQAATRRHGSKQIIWAPRLLLSETAESSTGVPHSSTPIKSEKLSSTIKHDMRTKFRGYRQRPDTGINDPLFHILQPIWLVCFTGRKDDHLRASLLLAN
ncbi:hypothetical protein O6H91_09G002900 [Diphasiastrum complanatum]|uniref:Uncharacterized protein n=1 Tax=Diphasiastrum complanatum TaxID=34168 RepID=A0ACC2CKT7_DIPCM|nr:hypothetical protein O6H91_Y387700 [Diphasiastrum complanatum]KAJ7542611.1 hypothetical protein O6H91_09G002900 [Diphasiastrum complanatum]